MEKEKALITVSGGALMESEVITSAIAFAQEGFGGLPVTLPKGYDISRSVKNFCFALPNVVNIGKATKESIMQAVHDYITQGLDVAKQQCALIVYGDRLTVQKEYFGRKALALRLNPDVAEISNGTIIYGGDEVDITYDNKGRMIIKHKTAFKNWQEGNESAVYVVVTYKDGTMDTELMTLADCKKAWSMSRNGDAVHKKFTTEMMKKTCIGRVCKKLINASDDSAILGDDESNLIDEYETLDINEVEYQEPAPTAPPQYEVVNIDTVVEPEPPVDTTLEDYYIDLPYSEYKNNKSNYPKSKLGTYNPAKKTIRFFPNKPDEAKTVADEPKAETDETEAV